MFDARSKHDSSARDSAAAPSGRNFLSADVREGTREPPTNNSHLPPERADSMSPGRQPHARARRGGNMGGPWEPQPRCRNTRQHRLEPAAKPIVLYTDRALKGHRPRLRAAVAPYARRAVRIPPPRPPSGGCRKRACEAAGCPNAAQPELSTVSSALLRAAMACWQAGRRRDASAAQAGSGGAARPRPSRPTDRPS